MDLLHNLIIGKFLAYLLRKPLLLSFCQFPHLKPSYNSGGATISIG